ncbi:hypothetical protein L6452_18754 [Arctium lappa]|uniref:Uncharacterized protein n=1 Tax=Arctium lappa TaxID=4217 RepID=A0ACB9C775_ARCLA|nr:hypothetical protein L6452_18754 [Arctium lappa]
MKLKVMRNGFFDQKWVRVIKNGERMVAWNNDGMKEGEWCPMAVKRRGGRDEINGKRSTAEENGGLAMAVEVGAGGRQETMVENGGGRLW